MEYDKCPNNEGCILIGEQNFLSREQKDYYMQTFCFSTNRFYTNCKRYQTSLRFHFCPDFVLPDTELSTDEILNKYEEGID
ncbi:MAG: hypothetical protein RBS13_04935 [Bacteroidales bacterium]|jgi:hypothetical protein|nr:hypothetical protein [Bacteroidales bacterium]